MVSRWQLHTTDADSISIRRAMPRHFTTSSTVFNAQCNLRQLQPRVLSFVKWKPRASRRQERSRLCSAKCARGTNERREQRRTDKQLLVASMRMMRPDSLLLVVTALGKWVAEVRCYPRRNDAPRPSVSSNFVPASDDDDGRLDVMKIGALYVRSSLGPDPDTIALAIVERRREIWDPAVAVLDPIALRKHSQSVRDVAKLKGLPHLEAGYCMRVEIHCRN